jgi:hypothetical protein
MLQNLQLEHYHCAAPVEHVDVDVVAALDEVAVQHSNQVVGCRGNKAAVQQQQSKPA